MMYENVTIAINIETDLIGVAFLIVMLRSTLRQRSNRFLPDMKLFEYIIIVNIALLLTDIGMWGFEQQTFSGAYTGLMLSTVLYYILNPLICSVWLFYTDYKLYGDVARLRRRAPFYLLSTALFAVLTIASIFTKNVFYIESTPNMPNHYVRSELFWLMPALSFVCLIYSFFLVFKKRHDTPVITKADKRVFFMLLVFPLIPFAGCIIQIMFFGLSLVWMCSVIAIQIIFLNIQSDQINCDFLTGLYNRRELNTYLTWKTEKMDGKKTELAAILIDIDRFKKINDTYGHPEGDRALQHFSDILQSVCRNNTKIMDDFVARYGGDEFIIIAERDSKVKIERFIDNIDEEVEKLNLTGVLPYKMSISVGYTLWSESKDIENFINKADEKMYKRKQHKQELLANTAF